MLNENNEVDTVQASKELSESQDSEEKGEENENVADQKRNDDDDAYDEDNEEEEEEEEKEEKEEPATKDKVAGDREKSDSAWQQYYDPLKALNGLLNSQYICIDWLVISNLHGCRENQSLLMLKKAVRGSSWNCSSTSIHLSQK